MSQLSPASDAETQQIAYIQRTADYYLHQINPKVLDSLDEAQRYEFKRIINRAIPKPAPKLVDLRFTIDVLFSKFYVVLLVGKDRRQRPRRRRLSSRLTRASNWLAAVILLLSLNLLISASVFLMAYLIKSAVGINLFPGHVSDTLQKISN